MRLSWRIVVVLLCAVILNLACAKRPTLPPVPGPVPTVAQGVAQFAYDKRPFDVDMEVTQEHPTYDVLRVTFPAYRDDDPANTEVVGWYYRQKTRQARAGIMQIPILGGDYEPTKMFATKYAREGFQVLWLERKSKLFDPERGMAHTRRVIVSTVIDQRRALDWWETLPEVDAKRIGISGISFGGFVGSIIMAIDDRPAAAALMLNGGDFPQLVVVSLEQEVIDAREEAMRLTGWDLPTLYLETAKIMAEIDPLVVAPLIDPTKKPILFVSPRFDQVVPYDLGDRWWRAANQPHRITIPTGHFSSIWFLFYIQDKCVEHFRDAFGYRQG